MLLEMVAISVATLVRQHYPFKVARDRRTYLQGALFSLDNFCDSLYYDLHGPFLKFVCTLLSIPSKFPLLFWATLFPAVPERIGT